MMSSSRASFHLVEKCSDFGEFFSGYFFGGQCAQNETACGAAEGAVGEVSQEQALGLALRLFRGVNVRLLALITGDRAFFKHDLHELEGGSIAGAAIAVELRANFPDGAGAAVPENSQNRQFRVGGAG